MEDGWKKIKDNVGIRCYFSKYSNLIAIRISEFMNIGLGKISYTYPVLLTLIHIQSLVLEYYE